MNAFPPLIGIESVPVPIELLNEPFSWKDDGLRSQVISTVKRGRFLFMITENGALSTIDGRVIARGTTKGGSGRSREQRLNKWDLPQKSGTNLSVISIYDMYGLEVACAFIKHIYFYKSDRDQPEWLETYLLGSLGVIWPEATYGHVERSLVYLCTALILQLKLLDDAQPRMIGQLKEGSQLPPELLAKITGSTLLSKEITDVVNIGRCGLPDYTWLEENYVQPNTRRLDDGSYTLVYSDDNSALQLIRRRMRFSLENVKMSAYSHSYDRAIRVAYSIDDYAKWFQQRGCDSDRYVTKMLEDLKKRTSHVTEENLEEVCAWIVQLTYDNNKEKNAYELYTDFEELGYALTQLIDEAILSMQG